MAYKHEAQKLLSVYESTLNPADFENAKNAYDRLIISNSFSLEDLFDYAYLHELCSKYYVNQAIKLYENVIEAGKESESKLFYKTQRQLIHLLAQNNRSYESIDKYKVELAEQPENPQSYISLCLAYLCAKQYDDAMFVIKTGLKINPDNAMMLYYMGEISKSLGNYDDAIKYWDKSLMSDNDMLDSLYSEAFLYTELNQKEDAIKAWERIITWLESHGFFIETEWPKNEIAKLKNR